MLGDAIASKKYSLSLSRSESEKDPAYFSNIVLAALVLAPSMDLTDPQNYRSLSKEVEKFYGQKSRFPEMMKVIRARILASEKIHGPKSEQLVADYTFQANCYFSKGKYRSTRDPYPSRVIYRGIWLCGEVEGRRGCHPRR